MSSPLPDVLYDPLERAGFERVGRRDGVLHQPLLVARWPAASRP